MRIDRALTLAKFELKQIWNNKRLLGLLLLVPIVICFCFGFVAYKNPTDISITAFVEKPENVLISSEIQKVVQGINDYTRDDGSQPFNVTYELNSQTAAMKKLNDMQTRALMILTQGQNGQLEKVEVTCAIGEPAITSVINLELGKYFDSYSKQISVQKLAAIINTQNQISNKTAIEQADKLLFNVKTVMLTDAWTQLRYFDFYASAIIVIMAIGMPMLISAISITSERARGTIERVFVSPYRKSEIILGKVLANSVMAIIFVVLFIGVMKLLFDMALGDIWLVMLLGILVGINGTVLGLLVSSVTYSEAESVIIGIMGMLGLMTMITYITPWETMHPVIYFISRIIPFTYGIQAIRQINMAGVGIAQVWPTLIILLVSIIGMTLIAIPVLRREVR